MNVIFGNKNIFSIEDLNNLEIEKENSDEKIDIFGEIGGNIFNEKEKIEQIIKYSKLIYNINFLIKENKIEDLLYISNLLHINFNNKKLMLFITNGSYSDFKNIKNNKFLQIQNILSLDSLLLFRNKKSLFRTIFLDKFFKKLKKDWKLLCDGTSDKKFDILIKESMESTFYEKAVKNLSKIEKKLKYIKTNIYEYFINKNNFINLCDKIMKTIRKKEMKKISKENFKKDKIYLLRNLMILFKKILLKNLHYF